MDRCISIFVGISGGSGSGKSTLVSGLVRELGVNHVAVLNHDSYYRDLRHLPRRARASVNFDHPDRLETDLLIRHLELLRRGDPVDVPVYDFSTHTRLTNSTISVLPKPTVLVDGMLILAEPRLRTLLDLSVFVDVPEETRFRRRLQRDARERLRTSESVLTQFESSVKPMHDAFVEPSRVHADIIVTKGGANLQARAQIVLRIRELAFRKGPRHTHR